MVKRLSRHDLDNVNRLIDTRDDYENCLVNMHVQGMITFRSRNGLVSLDFDSENETCLTELIRKELIKGIKRITVELDGMGLDIDHNPLLDYHKIRL